MNPIKLMNYSSMNKETTGEKRRSLGFIGETPTSNDIFTILVKLTLSCWNIPLIRK